MSIWQDTAFWTGLGGIAGGALTGFISGWWANRNKQIEKAPDIQASIDKMVQSMAAHYERLIALRDADIKELRAENVAMRRQLERLERHVDRIEAAMAAGGLEVPVRPEGL